MAASVYDRGDMSTLEGYFGLFETELTDDAAIGATTLKVKSAAQASHYAAADKLRLGGVDGEGGETVTVASVSGRTITLSGATTLAHAARTKVAELADTTTVGLQVRSPDAVVTSYATGVITHSSLGYYTKDVTLDQSGEWAYRWSGTLPGSLIGAAWRTLYVLPDPFE